MSYSTELSSLLKSQLLNTKIYFIHIPKTAGSALKSNQIEKIKNVKFNKR